MKDMKRICKPTRNFKSLAARYQTQYTAEAEADKPVWSYTRKLDGKYHQIVKHGTFVMVYTSGGKELKLPALEAEVLRVFKGVNVVLHCEFLGATEGKMGSRHGITQQTTWLANQRNGITNDLDSDLSWAIFDVEVYSEAKTPRTIKLRFHERSAFLERRLIRHSKAPTFLETVYKHYDPLTLHAAEDLARVHRDHGFEGGVIYHQDHVNFDTPRSPHKLKLKATHKAVGLLIEIIEGAGAASDSAGVLLVEAESGTVRIGTGWTHAQAKTWWENREGLKGYSVQYTYESLNQGTPQQCVYLQGLPT